MDPQNPYNKVRDGVPVIPALGGRDQKISEAHWQANPVNQQVPGSERDCISKKIRWRVIEENELTSDLHRYAHRFLQTNKHMHKYACTHAHIHALLMTYFRNLNI